MRSAQTIPIIAMVEPGEWRAVQLGIERTSAWLSPSEGASWPIDGILTPTNSDLESNLSPAVWLLSMLADADRLDEPWSLTQARVRQRVISLAGVPGSDVFILTVFRHVAADISAERRRALLGRIRRLDMLAVDLSHDLGVHVIDLDRALADEGAATLATDYRLGGEPAARVAGDYIARTLIAVGLQNWVPAKVQAQAEVRSADSLSSVRRRSDTTSPMTTVRVSRDGRPHVGMGAGPVEARATLLLQGLLGGRMSPRATWRAFSRALATRGARQTLMLGLAACVEVCKPMLRKSVAHRQ